MNLTKIIIIDTSAILSGIPLNFENTKLITTTDVSNELKPGGRDYVHFQFLITKGMSIIDPTKESFKKVKNASKETGDAGRLSQTDLSVLALALDYQNRADEVIVLTDDYSIQNLANFLNIKFETISQKGIKKRFKWGSRCRGCGKKFKDNISICPICGSDTKKIVSKEKNLGDK